MSLMLLLGKDPTSCPHSSLFVVVGAVVVEVVAVVVVVVEVV